MTQKREDLVAAVKSAKLALAFAESELTEFDEAPENNRYATLDDAYELEEVLRDRAYEDCQGAYNVGDSEYRQEFFVGDKRYIAIAEVEYNRHDKTYYYIDGFEFRIEEVA